MIGTAESIVGIIAFGAFLLVFYGPWQWVMTDLGRQIVIEERDAIFDMAVEGKLSFESEEYKSIRGALNSLIRFGHELSWPRFVLLLLNLKASGRDAEPSGSTIALAEISDQGVRDEVRERAEKARYAMTALLACKSIFFFPVGVFIFFAWLFGVTKLVRNRIVGLRIVAERVQVEADRTC